MTASCGSCNYPLCVSDSVTCLECLCHFHIDCAQLVGFPRYELSADPVRNSFICTTCHLLPIPGRSQEPQCAPDSDSDSEMPSRQLDLHHEPPGDLARDLHELRGTIQDLSDLCKDMLREINDLKSVNLTLRCSVENLRHDNVDRDKTIEQLIKRIEILEGKRTNLPIDEQLNDDCETGNEPSKKRNKRSVVFTDSTQHSHEDLNDVTNGNISTGLHNNTESNTLLPEQIKEKRRDWDWRGRRAVELNNSREESEAEEGETEESDIEEVEKAWEKLHEEVESQRRELSSELSNIENNRSSKKENYLDEVQSGKTTRKTDFEDSLEATKEVNYSSIKSSDESDVPIEIETKALDNVESEENIIPHEQEINNSTVELVGTLDKDWLSDELVEDECISDKVVEVESERLRDDRETTTALKTEEHVDEASELQTEINEETEDVSKTYQPAEDECVSEEIKIESKTLASDTEEGIDDNLTEEVKETPSRDVGRRENTVEEGVGDVSDSDAEENDRSEESDIEEKFVEEECVSDEVVSVESTQQEKSLSRKVLDETQVELDTVDSEATNEEEKEEDASVGEEDDAHSVNTLREGLEEDRGLEEVENDEGCVEDTELALELEESTTLEREEESNDENRNDEDQIDILAQSPDDKELLTRSSSLRSLLLDDVVEVEVGKIDEEAEESHDEESLDHLLEEDELCNEEHIEEDSLERGDQDIERCLEEDVEHLGNGIDQDREERLDGEVHEDGESRLEDDRLGEERTLEDEPRLDGVQGDVGVEEEDRLGGQSPDLAGEVQPTEPPQSHSPQHTEEDLWHYLKESVSMEHPHTVQDFLNSLIGTLQHVPEEYLQPVIEENIKRANSPCSQTDEEHLISPREGAEDVETPARTDSALASAEGGEVPRDEDCAALEQRPPQDSTGNLEEDSRDGEGYSILEAAA